MLPRRMQFVHAIVCALIGFHVNSCNGIEIELGCVNVRSLKVDACLVNDNASDLRVTGVTTSCGCLKTPTIPPLVKGRNSEKFPVEIDVTRPGPIQQHVIVKGELNGGGEKTYRFDLTGVAEGVWAKQTAIDFGTVSRDSPQRCTQELIVCAAGDAREREPVLTIDGIPATSKLVSKTRESLRNVSIAVYRYELSLDRQSDNKTGTFNGTIEVDIGTPDRVCRIQSHVSLTGDWVVRPTQVFFGRLRPGTSSTRTVIVKCQSPNAAIDQIAIETASDEIRAKTTVVDAKTLSVELTYTAPTEANEEAAERGAVRLRNADEAMFQIPYLALKVK